MHIKTMEISYKYQWHSIIISAIFSAIALVALYFKIDDSNRIVIAIPVLVLLTFPNFLKFFLTLSYRPIKAEVIKSRDLSKVIMTNKGGATCNYQYEAALEYSVNGKKYSCLARRSDGPFLKEVILFYNPKDPFYFSLKKKMSLSGWGFFLVIGFAAWIMYLEY